MANAGLTATLPVRHYRNVNWVRLAIGATVACVFALFALFAVPATAQQAGRTVRLVVPYPPGGTADALARAVAAPLGTLLGQSVLVENRPGAAGAIGAASVSRAEPDGATLLFTNVGPSAIAPAMSKSAPYDPVKDFAAVALVARSPLVLVTNPSLEAKDLRGLIDVAKANPARIEYSSAGLGSFGHLSTELFAQAAGIRLLHVPYQGQAPSVTAVVSGEVKISLTAPSGAMFDMIRANRVRLLGVSSREPSRLAPGATPIAEVIPNFVAEFWFGIVAPAKTPDLVLQSLHAGIQKVLSEPALIKQFETLGSEVASGSSAEFQRLIESEAQRWREVVQRAGIASNN
jgi:tripartite-type tricarboxylate transporter receptor subunit TctC